MLANNKRLNNRYMFASWAEPTPEMIEQMGMKGANLPFMVLLMLRDESKNKPKDELNDSDVGLKFV
jgi:hypothetical protein